MPLCASVADEVRCRQITLGDVSSDAGGLKRKVPCPPAGGEERRAGTAGGRGWVLKDRFDRRCWVVSESHPFLDPCPIWFPRNSDAKHQTDGFSSSWMIAKYMVWGSSHAERPCVHSGESDNTHSSFRLQDAGSGQPEDGNTTPRTRTERYPTAGGSAFLLHASQNQSIARPMVKSAMPEKRTTQMPSTKRK